MPAYVLLDNEVKKLRHNTVSTKVIFLKDCNEKEEKCLFCVIR